MNSIKSALAIFAAGALVGALAVVEIVPPTSTQLAGAGGPGDALAAEPTDAGRDVGGAGSGGADTQGAEAADGATVATQGSSSTSPGGTSSGGTSGGGTSGDGGASTTADGGTAGGSTTTTDSGGSNSNAGDSTSDDAGGGGSASTAAKCEAGSNGGATATGVTGNSIKLATTVVESGIGSAFLGEARFGMEAVKNQVNRGGGVCGRQLEVTYRDDGWNTQRGAQFLRNFIADGVFAIPVGPSSEGLNAVIQAGDFDANKVAVVGTDGLIERQYIDEETGTAQQWVWPIAAATVSSARIMAKDAFERMTAAGIEPTAADFSVVFDFNYKFGEEGAEAFNQEVKRLTGEDIPGYETGSNSCNKSYCGVRAGQSGYGSQVQSFEEGRFVALFLEPDTALKWMNDPNTPAASDIEFGYGAAQPLFTRSFAENCKSKCHTMVTWTGFKPFEEQYRSDPAVQDYVNDLRTACRSCDPNNQFTQGAYIGMQLLVEGLKATGPNLTRDGFKKSLDHLSFTCDLCLEESLDYSPDNRFVATTMQGWEIQYSGTFAGWKAGNIVSDPRF